MRKLRIVLFSFLGIGILFPVFFTLLQLGVFKREPSVVIKNQVPQDAPLLRVVADYDFCPYSFLDSNGNVSGLDVELVNEIANRLGYKADISFLDWQGCKTRLQTGEADLILGLEIFSHMTGVNKTVAVSQDELVVFGKNEIYDVSQLKDKKVALMINSIIELVFDLNCEYMEYFTNTDILKAVEDGTVDFGICHNSVAKKIIEKNGYNLKPSAILMQSYPSIGVRKDLVQLHQQINDVIYEIGQEGLIKKLDEKWLIKFTHNTTLSEVFKNDFRFYLIYFCGFCATLFIMHFLYVEARHKELEYRKSIEYQESMLRQYNIVNAISGIYMTTHVIDLVNDAVVEMNSIDVVRPYVNKNDQAAKQMREVMKALVMPDDVLDALEFTDLTTVAQRLAGKKSIIEDFHGSKTGWFSAQFVPLEYDDEGNITEVIFTTRSIDEIRKEKEHLQLLSTVDQLTQLFNRHAFEMMIQEIHEKKSEKVTVIEFDVNGLKQANDNIGHAAGDELICGAASCIARIFAPLGTCYRTGGDEFAVIINNVLPDISAVITRFKNQVSQWQGDLVPELAVSTGYASSSDIENFNHEQFAQLFELADKRMYKDKENFYKSKGVDRRGQVEAFVAVCDLYTKILKVDLLKDTHQSIKTNEDERDESKGYAEKLSEWFWNFAHSGQVHPDNKEEFLKFTNIEYLREYFLSGKKIISTKYSRMIGDKFVDVVMELVAARDYSENNQIAFLYVKPQV